MLGSLLLVLVMGGGPERVLIQRAAQPGTVRDCYIWESSPAANGNGDVLYVGLVGAGEKSTLVWFDLGGVPIDARVIEARLFLEADGTSGVPITLSPLSARWAESEPTWATFSTLRGGSVASFTPVLGRNLVPVTDVVREWVAQRTPNFGLMLTQAPGLAPTTFRGSEYATASLRPALDVLFERAQPLAATEVPALEAECGVKLQYPLSAHVPEATSFSVEGAPEGLLVDGASGALSWTPASSLRGVHQLTVSAAEGNRTAKLHVEIEVRCSEPFRARVGCVTASGLWGWLALLWPLLGRRQRRAKSFGRGRAGALDLRQDD